MADVSGRVCALLIQQIRMRGVTHDSDRLDLEALREDAARVSWDDFTHILERAAELEGVHSDVWWVEPSDVPVDLLRALARVIDDVRDLYHAGARHYAPWLFTNLQVTCVDLPNGHVLQTIEIPPHQRDCPTFFQVMREVFTRIPVLLGQPPVHVDMEVSRRRAQYTIHARRPPGRLRRALRTIRGEQRPRLDSALRELGAWAREVDKKRRETLLDELELATQASELEAFDQLGQLMGRRVEVDEIVEHFCVLCVRKFGFVGVSMTLSQPSSELERAWKMGATSGEPKQSRELKLSGRPIASLDLWHGDQAPSGAGALDVVLPWIALAIDDACARLAIAGQARRLEAETVARQRAEAELLQAQRMVGLGRLARRVSHDIANVLTIVSGRAELAIQKLDPDLPAMIDMQEIRVASQRGTQLVRRLGILAPRPSRPERLDLNDVVTELEPMLRIMLGEQRRLELNLTRALASIRIDRAQLEQVVYNLVENSRDATPAGGCVRISTSRLLRPSTPDKWGDVRLQVLDDGRGMDAETCKRVFEPFFTTKPPDTSSGLGLTAAHSIVQQAGGSIGIDSRPGSGTTVTIELPCYEGASDDPYQPAEIPRGRGETILLAEDDPQLRALAQQALETSNYRVLAAPDSLTALTLARECPEAIPLLVTDVVMPGLDGRELVDKLLTYLPDLRVIYVSGYQDADLGVWGPLPRQVDFLRKPFSPKHMHEAVGRALG